MKSKINSKIVFLLSILILLQSCYSSKVSTIKNTDQDWQTLVIDQKYRVKLIDNQVFYPFVLTQIKENSIVGTYQQKTTEIAKEDIYKIQKFNSSQTMGLIFGTVGIFTIPFVVLSIVFRNY